jgi:hypothetical protein
VKDFTVPILGCDLYLGGCEEGNAGGGLPLSRQVDGVGGDMIGGCRIRSCWRPRSLEGFEPVEAWRTDQGELVERMSRIPLD